LDAGTVRVFVEAAAPRVSCPVHGVVVAHVPWARHGAGHTLAYDQTVAWLVTQCSKTAVTGLMRIAWRTVGRSSPGCGLTSKPSATAWTG
jgi:transposase